MIKIQVTEYMRDGDLMAVEAYAPEFSGESFLTIQIALEQARPDLAAWLKASVDCGSLGIGRVIFQGPERD